MRILVIFTGGTIGSSVTDGYISPNVTNKSKLINMYKEIEKSSQEFDEDIPYTVLSENIGGEHITKLIHCLDRHIKSKKYDGIIITHGTDTLQYMAAALSIVFEAVDIPVMLVSSNYPLENSCANGYDNFKSAVEYIKNKGTAGLYVPYKNVGEEMKIFTAYSMLRYDIYSDKIRRLEIENSKVIESKINQKTGSVNDVSIDRKNKGILQDIMHINPENINLSEISPIKFIMPYPGISYEIPGPDIKAVLFGSYHSGTIQTSRRELINFCSEMKKRNIQMYICGVPKGLGYESTKYYNELGIEVLPYGTDIYWYMKLWIMYS